MGKKLFVGNLPCSVTAVDLSSRFSKFGIVTSADVIMEEITSRNRRSGLVEMATDAGAIAAINGLNFTQFGDLTMSVRAAPLESSI